MQINGGLKKKKERKKRMEVYLFIYFKKFLTENIQNLTGLVKHISVYEKKVKLKTEKVLTKKKKRKGKTK